MKNIIIIILVILVLVGVGAYFFMPELFNRGETVENEEITEEEMNEQEETEEQALQGETTIGTSAGGSVITAHTFGTGDTHLLFVGGIHGGYEWNTVLLAYELVDYFAENPTAIPNDVMVTVIPVLNPDGLEEVTGSTGRFSQADVPAGADATVPGRFNGNGVDLNRNFDCDWQTTGMWRNTEVDAGTSAFSEPESAAVRDFVNEHDPDAVVVYYSAAGGVFASNCHSGVLPETTTLTNLYADASGYPAFEEFDFYEITGDMVNWLAREGIPGISVLLTNHTDVEWSKNRAGVDALLEYYAEAN